MRWSDDLARKGQVGANHLIANRLWQLKVLVERIFGWVLHTGQLYIDG